MQEGRVLQFNICPLMTAAQQVPEPSHGPNRGTYRQKPINGLIRIWHGCMWEDVCESINECLCDLLLSLFYVPTSLPKLKFHAWGLTGVILSAKLYYLFLCRKKEPWDVCLPVCVHWRVRACVCECSVCVPVFLQSLALEHFVRRLFSFQCISKHGLCAVKAN